MSIYSTVKDLANIVQSFKLFEYKIKQIEVRMEKQEKCCEDLTQRMDLVYGKFDQLPQVFDNIQLRIQNKLLEEQIKQVKKF